MTWSRLGVPVPARFSMSTTCSARTGYSRLTAARRSSRLRRTPLVVADTAGTSFAIPRSLSELPMFSMRQPHGSHASQPWMMGTLRCVTWPLVRDELIATLEQTQRLARQLADDARDHQVPVADLVAQATMLERLDQRREELIGQLRR